MGSHAQEGGEFRAGIDAEYHAFVTVGCLDCLRAIKPERTVCLHFVVDEDDAGMVQFVDLVETSIEATGERLTGSVEAGLGDSMVGGIEVEVDDVANSCIELVRTVDQVTIRTDDDIVCCSWSERCGFAGGGGWWWQWDAGRV